MDQSSKPTTKRLSKRWAVLLSVGGASAAVSAFVFVALSLNNSSTDFDIELDTPTVLLAAPADDADGTDGTDTDDTGGAADAGGAGDATGANTAPGEPGSSSSRNLEASSQGLRFVLTDAASPDDAGARITGSPAEQAGTGQSKSLPAAVTLAGGRTWVPWPPATQSPATKPSANQPSQQQTPAADYFNTVAQLWQSAMPPYTPAAAQRLKAGKQLAQKNSPYPKTSQSNQQNGSWQRVVDSTGLQTKIHLNDDRKSGWEQIRLCPPHPASPAARQLASYQLRDGNPQLIKKAQQLAQQIPTGDSAAEFADESAQFVADMQSPTGMAVPSSGDTRSLFASLYARLLAYSPGEPTELASSGHSLTDSGFFPGDWSAQARQLLMQYAAAAALADSNVWHAAQSIGPQSLWEACQDLVAISLGDNTDSGRLAQLETLWSRGIRLAFTSPPQQRAYIAELSATGQAQVLLCHPADEVYLTDANTGERLERFKRRNERVEALSLRWVMDRFRAVNRAEFEGECDAGDPGSAFARALAWSRSQAAKSDARFISAQPHAWASGLSLTWIPIHEWVAISDSQVWDSWRSPAWSNRKICEAGIVRGRIVDAVLEREAGSGCTAAEQKVMRDAAALAPVRTTELSGTVWEPEDSWFERMYLSRFRSIEEELGCDPPAASRHVAADVAPGRHVAANAAPDKHRVKRPWPPGLLHSTKESPPHFPCPAAQVPPNTNRYWWPPTTALSAAAHPSALSAAANSPSLPATHPSTLPAAHSPVPATTPTTGGPTQ